jgi:hypothetical protein
VGYEGFMEVGRRLNELRGEEIVWMRPSEIAGYRHVERHTRIRMNRDGRSFEMAAPFEAKQVLSLRWTGESGMKLKGPGGEVVEAWRRGPGFAMFDVVPRNGRWEVV